MKHNIFNKFSALLGLLSMFGANSSKEFKLTEAGETRSLSKYAQSNFDTLPMKRVKGKWRVKR